MVVRRESIQQTTTGAWAASSTVTVLLDRIGLVTRYDVVFQLTPSATFVGANQPDGLYRSFQNLRIVAGGQQYMALPSEAGGHGGTLLHFLNLLDGFGVGHGRGAITAPDRLFVPIKVTMHAGVRPRRRDGLDNPFDLTCFIPAGIESSPQIEWTTPGNAVADDVVTIASGTLVITAHRVLGSTEEIRQEMQDQGVSDVLTLLHQGDGGLIPDPSVTGFVPGWYGQIESPTAVADSYGSELDAQLGGFLKRVVMVAQDATATRPVRALDEITQIRLIIPEQNQTILQSDSERMMGYGPVGDQLGADDVTILGNATYAGIYNIDLRPYGRSRLEQVMGLDFRGKQTGYAKWGRTLLTNATGDDLYTFSERLLAYRGRLSNS